MPAATVTSGADAPAPGPRLDDPRALADYAATLDCIHCGLCLDACPTYRLTGVESSSPRGRIHLMRAVAEERVEEDAAFAEEMDFCLACRSCESVCPAGVRFGEMMEHTRDRLAAHGAGGRLRRLLVRAGLRLVLPRRPALGIAASALRALQVLRLARPMGAMLGARGRALAALPPVPPRSARGPLPAHTAARGIRRTGAVVLQGCVMRELFPQVNRATLETLSRLGVECHADAGHVCCGALHAHNGDMEGARRLARRTIERCDTLGDGLEIAVNSAGCGAHMKDYGRLLADDAAWAERARAFAARVRDYAELAAPLLDGPHVEHHLAPGALAGPVAWDDPCHLCHGQGVRDAPRRLLDSIEGLERVELERPEACCGSAGLYSVLRPADSAAVLDERLEDLRRSRARVLVTANPGCQLQWRIGVRRAGLDVRVLHLAELLELAQRP